MAEYAPGILRFTHTVLLKSLWLVQLLWMLYILSGGIWTKLGTTIHHDSSIYKFCASYTTSLNSQLPQVHMYSFKIRMKTVPE